MTEPQRINLYTFQRVLVISSILFSGLCWYLSLDLSGNYWYLLWLAPVPLLIISYRATARMTFAISFIAYLLGKLSWFTYLVSVATIIPAIIFTLALPLFFALVMLITRQTIIKYNSWYTVFSFPVFFTVFEYLLIEFSPDGTVGSIAYSQSNFLPFIQIASVTGILGITFLVCFIPSAIAIGWRYRREKTKFRYLIFVACIIVGSAILFGSIRISFNYEKGVKVVGLAVLDEHFHHITDQPDFEKERMVTANYIKEIAALAARGAQLIVLPERAINITKGTGDTIINMLCNAAKQYHVFIIGGYTNFRNDQPANSALVINDEGSPVINYNKVFLVTGLESQFRPGRNPGTFKLNGIQAGTAICKDLDFPDYIKKYGRDNIAFLCIPAWDFVKDDWLHSRMAILRGVENGFSEVRTARQGRLTVSNWYGKITYEADCSAGQGTTLLGKISLQKRDTVYSYLPDWFGIANLIAAAFLIFFKGKNRNTGTSTALKKFTS